MWRSRCSRKRSRATPIEWRASCEKPEVLASLNQRRTGINPVNREQWWRYRLPGFGSIDWPAFLTILMDAGYQGAMNIEHEDALYGWPYASDEFSDIYKDGFRIGLQYLRQYLPASALQTRG